jgi:hypothetical protein
MGNETDDDKEFPPPMKVDDNAFKRVSESGQAKTLLGSGAVSEDEHK